MKTEVSQFSAKLIHIINGSRIVVQNLDCSSYTVTTVELATPKDGNISLSDDDRFSSETCQYMISRWMIGFKYNLLIEKTGPLLGQVYSHTKNQHLNHYIVENNYGIYNEY